MLTNPPVLYDFCVGIPISHLLTVGSTPIQHSVLNVKALLGTFNIEKALVGAFSGHCETSRRFVSSSNVGPLAARPSLSARLRLVASVSPNRRPRPLGTTEGRLWHYGLDAVVGNSQAAHTDLDK